MIPVEGRFYKIEMGEMGTFLYQKVKNLKDENNFVLLNTGELCNIHSSIFEKLEEVSVEFNLQNLDNN